MIERTFKRALKTIVLSIWHVMTERRFSLSLTKVGIHFSHVRMCATPYPISCIIFILDLGPSYMSRLSYDQRQLFVSPFFQRCFVKVVPLALLHFFQNLKVIPFRKIYTFLSFYATEFRYIQNTVSSSKS